MDSLLQEYSQYQLAWAAYYGGAAGLLLAWWCITAQLPWLPLRQILRYPLAGLLLVPSPVTLGAQEQAPALFVLAFDLAFLEQGDPTRAVPYLLYGLILSLAALILDGLIRFLWSKRSA